MNLLIAIAVYLLAASGVAHLETRLDDASDVTPLQKWLRQELYLPMLRAAVLLVFMLLAYRSIFGLTDQHPGFTELVDLALVSQGMNLLFVLPFLLALLPNSAAFTPFLLPSQSIALTALVYLQIADRLEIEADLVPDLSVITSLLLLSVASHLVSSRLPARVSGDWKRYLEPGELSMIIWQLPIFLVYGRALGQTLS